MSTKILETELIRKKLYENILNKVYKLKLQKQNGKFLTIKDNSNLLLRYIFNLIIVKSINDDSIFITTVSKIANEQIIIDFKYFDICNYNVKDFINLLNTSFIEAKQILNESKIPDDDEITINMTYKGKIYEDICNLGNKNLKLQNYAIALSIRYTYIKLQIHSYGLPNKLDYLPNQAIELFASAFNNSFDKYYSAFPDLERVFGSKGSFLELKELMVDNPKVIKILICNPPFNVHIILLTINKIKELLENTKSSLIIHLTVPKWKNIFEFNELKDYKFTKSYEIIENKTYFIDYMTSENIRPCDIIKIKLVRIICNIPKQFRLKKTN
jgi:hypothetical protein